jgi:hypothetical protein
LGNWILLRPRVGPCAKRNASSAASLRGGAGSSASDPNRYCGRNFERQGEVDVDGALELREAAEDVLGCL